MANRSLFISFMVTVFLGFSFTFGLTDSNSFFKKIPDWLGIMLLSSCAILYLLAAWWAFQGFHGHKSAAITSLGLCAFGLGIYGLGFSMEVGKGKASPGQYDYALSDIDLKEKAILSSIATQAGTDISKIVFTEHWHLVAPSRNVRVCVQKGHVTAINLSNFPIENLALLSLLPYVSDLYLKNCGLSDMSALKSARLERLDVSDNQITDLKTLSNCPNIRWLFASNNQLKSTDGIGQFTQMVSKDLSGNPFANGQ